MDVHPWVREPFLCFGGFTPRSPPRYQPGPYPFDFLASALIHSPPFSLTRSPLRSPSSPSSWPRLPRARCRTRRKVEGQARCGAVSVATKVPPGAHASPTVKSHGVVRPPLSTATTQRRGCNLCTPRRLTQQTQATTAPPSSSPIRRQDYPHAHLGFRLNPLSPPIPSFPCSLQEI